MKGFALALPLFGNPAFAQDASAGPAGGVYNLLVGTYTGSGSDGIYVYRFDTDSGRVSPVSSAKAENPSYLVASRDGRHVYAVNELPGDAGPASVRGGVSAFDFDAKTGALKFVNRVSAQGNDPCYLSLSPDGRYLVVANYSVASDPGGSFSVFPVEATGALGAAVLNVHHEGTGPVKGRQDGAHVHSTVFSPDGKYLFVQDLGADKLYSYRYTPDGSRGLIGPTESRYTLAKAGSGPRHLVFGANGRFAYVTNELNASVDVYRYDDGRLAHVETVPMTAPGFAGKVGGGALHLSPDGRFLYATNRGDANDIVIYAVNAADGKLTLVGRQSSLGKTPREFAIDPSGKWLIVGNQDSDSMFVFRRDIASGRLEPNPARIRIDKPVDFKFVPVQ
ncbi:lactonase family protein [Burkholderia pseudomallei]|uniref:3-carboxymuconate cyclase n=3 Tax=Burkholderia pseudomallei TaxID=28450 RepID=A0A0H3HQ51_BURP2|nr:lactonase family protein [Burkholderia pseudomallei]AFI67030.1 3-carboxymuconate cyclase [Burkholderia pseudomallei 1026b]AGR70301.1 lactonase, 7-bladed beta-propeller family protein [Burkholderia pseudomallei MSHR305]AIP14493.1 lactonase, 7-bladed beta-propeller family protein [Burkholderia pseudomallei]AIP23847.1 lactonase, 7-bladed beta-propeller family protein [Burkholderia pseudomallei MSHR5855]AIP39068.1 lactonase, 7-bladed beta-propeller family protein [Burkholderia pseudomallei MSHR